MADQDDAADVGGFQTLMFVRDSVDDWLPAVTRLLKVPGAGEIVLAVPGDAGWARSRMPDDDRITCVVAAELRHDAARAVEGGETGPVLVMTSPVLLPADGLAPRPGRPPLGRPGRDGLVPRNAAGLPQLSRTATVLRPYCPRPATTRPRLTRLLRGSGRAMAPAPITVPAGAACLVAATAGA